MNFIDWNNNVRMKKSYKPTYCYLCDKKVYSWNMVWNTRSRHRVNICNECFECHGGN